MILIKFDKLIIKRTKCIFNDHIIKHSRDVRSRIVFYKFYDIILVL